MGTTEKHPNYLKLLMDSPEGHDHPIDLAARERIDADDAERSIRGLQGTVRKHLDLKGEKAFMKLGDLHNDLSDRRAEAYFNLGFERGLLEGAARASGVTLSEQEEQLARDLRERLAQAQLSPEKEALVVHELQGAVLLRAPTATPPGRLALEAGAPQ